MTHKKYSNKASSSDIKVASNSDIGQIQSTKLNPGKLFDNQAHNLNNDELINAEELSLRLNISLKTIRGWRYKRILPSDLMLKTGPRLVRYRWQAIRRWLQI